MPQRFDAFFNFLDLAIASQIQSCTGLGMTTTNTPQNSIFPTNPVELLATMQMLRLTPGQRATMFEDICAAIKDAGPTSKVDVRNWATIVTSFVADIAPIEGGDLWAYLTDAGIASWVSRLKLDGRPLHTLNTRRGVLQRILAAHRGLRVGQATQPRRGPSTAPLLSADSLKLMRACEADSRSAVRGYVAHVAANVPQGARRVVFKTDGAQHHLSSEYEAWAIVPVDMDLSALHGDRLIDEDWRALKAIAKDLGIRLSDGMAAQTFRIAAVSDDALSLRQRFSRYGLNEVAITSTASHLTPLSDIDWLLSREVLRNGRPEIECTTLGSSTPSPGPLHGGTKGGSHKLTRKTSRAASKRLAVERTAELAAKKLKAGPVEKYLENFIPDDDDVVWTLIAETVRSSVTECVFTNIETARKHAVALTAYLRWRATNGYSTLATISLTNEGIDAFFVHGMEDLSERSRRDYRSRLRTIAKRANASVAAPPALKLGYNQVNPGYSETEERSIRRVALQQGRAEPRRRLCAIVGFCCGAGLSSDEVRSLRRSAVTIGEDGTIEVQVPGTRPRRTVVRRDYEEHVLVAIEGLKDDQTVLPQLRTASPITAILKGADLFDDAPAIDTRRLRTTWIAWLMAQRVPLQLAFEASGLQSARTFYDLLAYFPKSASVTELRDGGAK